MRAWPGDMLMQPHWNSCYPAYPPRPDFEAWPPWYQISATDLANFFPRSGIDLWRIRSVLDLGSGDGYRVMYALLHNPALNRPDLHVTCVDWATRAIAWGVDLWGRVRRGVEMDQTRLPTGLAAEWSMEFRDEDVLALPGDLAARRYDIVMDWMLLHCLPREQVAAYAALIRRLGPEYYVLKCCSVEGSTLGEAPATQHGLPRTIWAEEAVRELLGEAYELARDPYQCPENKQAGHGDGPETAKREYCFRRRAVEREVEPAA